MSPFDETKRTEIEREAIREELTRVLDSRHFRASKRGKQFLQYIVEQTLRGEGESLKERLIGTEVFGRRPDYSTGEDPVVRVQAGDVRRRLNLYQADNQSYGPVRIELPSGSYVPVFRLRASLTEESPKGQSRGMESGPTEESPGGYAASDALDQHNRASGELESLIGSSAFVQETRREQVTKSVTTARRSRKLILLTSFCCLLAVLVFTLLHLQRAVSAQTELKSFWNSVLQSPRPVLLCVAKPILYRPSADLFERYAKEHPGSFQTDMERQSVILPLKPDDMIRWGDMIPRENSGPAIGGVMASLNFSRLFTQLNKPYEVRFGQEASFTELRDSPGVIIGAINTQWTTNMTSGLHFVFEETNGTRVIHETTGSRRTWQIGTGPHGERIRDYGLITRLIVSRTGQPLVQVAGMTDYGTQAASELVTNQAEFDAMIGSAPRGWEKKNLQILVGTDISEGKAGPPQVIAVSAW